MPPCATGGGLWASWTRSRRVALLRSVLLRHELWPIFDSMIRSFCRSFVAGLTVLAVVTVPSLANIRLSTGRTSSVASEATAINLKASDLSTSMHWAISPPGKASKASKALAKKTVAV